MKGTDRIAYALMMPDRPNAQMGWRDMLLVGIGEAIVEHESSAKRPVITHHPGTDRRGHPSSECEARGCHGRPVGDTVRERFASCGRASSHFEPADPAHDHCIFCGQPEERK